MRVYRRVVDSTRWQRFEPRPDDVIISTPSKCGTTWMQQLVAMLVLGRVELGASLASLSPWLDVLMTPEAETFATLDAQTHRRFIKTHTPLDGVPYLESWTYITVFRHPLDAALSMRDHDANMDRERTRAMMNQSVDELPTPLPPAPEDIGEFIRYWIAADIEPDGAGPNCLADYANSLAASWEWRERPNVHLFHYDDMWSDLDGELARLAELLEVDVDPELRATMVEAGTIDSMRARGSDAAPYGDQAIWHDATKFFRSGGRRAWPELLTGAEIADVTARLTAMVGDDAARWALR